VIIVSGRIHLRDGEREAFLETSLPAVEQARRTEGCHDFVVAADPVEPDRVNVYEEWETEEALLAFRSEGPGEDLSGSIVDAKVLRHKIASSGPA
jgi:quinol monooxygenase YgiN